MQIEKDGLVPAVISFVCDYPLLLIISSNRSRRAALGESYLEDDIKVFREGANCNGNHAFMSYVRRVCFWSERILWVISHMKCGAIG